MGNHRHFRVVVFSLCLNFGQTDLGKSKSEILSLYSRVTSLLVKVLNILRFWTLTDISIAMHWYKGTQSEGAENRTLEHFQSTCHAETSRQNTMFLFLTENV